MRQKMPQLPTLHDQPVLDLAQKAALAAALRQRDRRIAPGGQPRQVLDRIAGLLEFGGTVSTQIRPKEEGQTGLPVGGAGSGLIRYTVNAPRHYKGKRAIRTAVALSVDQFESILLDYLDRPDRSADSTSTGSDTVSMTKSRFANADWMTAHVGGSSSMTRMVDMAACGWKRGAHGSG